MPREIVHWDLVHRTVERLAESESQDLFKIAREHSAFLALGAIAHDAPYYRSGGGARFELVGSLLHGLGGPNLVTDPLHPLSVFGSRVVQLPDRSHREPGLAFLMGLLSHYVVDVVYHPAIFFFTGDYYASEEHERRNARARHRLFEVYLDEDRRAGGLKIPWPISISAILGLVPPPTLHLICALLAESVASAVAVFDPSLVGDLPGEWERALRESGCFQHMFLSQGWGAAAQVLNLLSFRRLEQFEVLFARGRVGHHSALHEPWNYRNPVSGEQMTTSILELDERAIGLMLELFGQVQCALDSGSSDALSLPGGVSLNYGLKDTAPEDATFFCSEGFPLPGLRR